MNIQDALKETGKAYDINDDGNYAALDSYGILRWYAMVNSNSEIAAAELEEILEIDWQSYHPKEEIRPSEENELWEPSLGAQFITREYDDQLYFVTPMILDKTRTISHLCAESCTNEWKRLHPPVNDEEVIVIEADNVILEGRYGGHQTIITKNGKAWEMPERCKNKPMTMTLTIPKEKEND